MNNPLQWTRLSYITTNTGEEEKRKKEKIERYFF